MMNVTSFKLDPVHPPPTLCHPWIYGSDCDSQYRWLECGTVSFFSGPAAPNPPAVAEYVLNKTVSNAYSFTLFSFSYSETKPHSVLCKLTSFLGISSSELKLCEISFFFLDLFYKMQLEYIIFRPKRGISFPL